MKQMSKFLQLVILVWCIVSCYVSGQAACPASTLACNCNGNTDDIRDLQERVICLENAMDQIAPGAADIIRDCSDIANNGSEIYRLSTKSSESFYVPCVFDADGEWTVIQQRVSGDVDFNRAWVEYQEGFGIMSDTGSFWLGLEKMHQITKQRQYTLRIDLKDWDDSMHYAEYTLFSVGDEVSKYVLALDGHSGTLAEALIERANGRPFSTLDQDNDVWENNCARYYATGWWHLGCYIAQLNGPYRATGDDARNDAKGIIWRPYKGYNYSMKYARMRIKPTFSN